MNCPHCGAEIKEGTFCKTCGASLHDNPYTQYESTGTLTQVMVPALVCGVPAGVVSIFMEDICCLWVLLVGGLSVYFLRRFNNIVDKIPTKKAFLTGGLTGIVVSLFVVGNTAVMLSQGEMESMFDDMMTSPEYEEALKESEMTEEEIQEAQELMREFSSNFLRWGLVMMVIISLVVLPLFGGLAGIIANEIIPSRK